MKYLALLRGVNVGGKNKLPMKNLAAMFEAAGCTQVQTFIQSGNVVFEANPKTLKNLSVAICAAIKNDFAFETHIVIRSQDELANVIAATPYTNAAILNVVFLASQPAPELIAKLDPNRSPPDEFQVIGREIYLSVPNGMGRTKLTSAFFDSGLKTIGTVRNWRTVLKLHELLSSS